MMKFVIRIMLVILCVGFLAACSRVSQTNFDKIQTGMSMREVVAILGEPTTSNSMNIGGFSGTSATWEYHSAVIAIQFINDKVQVKSFSNTSQGDNHDAQSPPAG